MRSHGPTRALLAVVTGVLVAVAGLPLGGAGASGSPRSLDLRLVARLPAVLRPYATAPVGGAEIVGARLWIAFEGLSTHATRGPCLNVTACAKPLPPPTHGLIAVFSTTTGRVVRTIATGTLPRLTAADGNIWVSTARSFPRDSSLSPDMAAVPAIGGGWVREYDGRSGRLLGSYKVPFPTDIAAAGKRAYVLSLVPGRPYEGGSLLELEGGHVRTVAEIRGVTYGPMTVCDGRVAVATTIPSKATPSSSHGPAGGLLTVVSLGSHRQRSEPAPTVSWTTCAGRRIALVRVAPHGRAITLYDGAWPPRPVASLPGGTTSIVAAPGERGLWLMLSTGTSRTSPYVVKRYEGGRLANVPVHPPVGDLQADTWSLAARGPKLFYLSGGGLYSLTASYKTGDGLPGSLGS